MSKPRYQGVKDKDFPRFELGEHCTGRLMAGDIQNKKGPCLTHTPINVFDLTFEGEDDIELSLSSGSNTVIFVLRGEVSIEQNKYAKKNLIAFSREGRLLKYLETKNCKVLVLNGEPIDEPIFAHGPFVMNTREEIIQAINDYQSGKNGSPLVGSFPINYGDILSFTPMTNFSSVLTYTCKIGEKNPVNNYCQNHD